LIRTGNVEQPAGEGRSQNAAGIADGEQPTEDGREIGTPLTEYGIDQMVEGAQRQRVAITDTDDTEDPGGRRRRCSKELYQYHTDTLQRTDGQEQYPQAKLVVDKAGCKIAQCRAQCEKDRQGTCQEHRVDLDGIEMRDDVGEGLTYAEADEKLKSHRDDRKLYAAEFEPQSPNVHSVWEGWLSVEDGSLAYASVQYLRTGGIQHAP